jgi:hypothetical protein
MRFTRTLIATATGVVAFAVALLPGTASADSFALHMSAPAAAKVGTPFQITSTGHDPPDSGSLYLEIDAIPTSFTTSCPAGEAEGRQFAVQTGGDFVAFDEPESYDSSGNFKNVDAEKRAQAGDILLCGYTNDIAGNTLATASAIVQIGGKASKPKNTHRPRVTRHKNTLTCHRGSWTGHPHFSFRWLKGSKAIKKATKSKLAVTHGLRGHSVACRVTAKNGTGRSHATSHEFKVK